MKNPMLTRYVALSIALLSITFGCKTNDANTGDFAYLGGEIVNPKNKNVILYNTEGKVVDSFKLDSNNRFIHKFTNLQSGLYSITHGGEYQMVLLEPNDSIMFRLNTYDFDESLVFTGNGAKKNNYLIRTYLSNEQEEKKLIKYAKIEPEAFNLFIEERRKIQLDNFHDFLAQNDESDFFKSIIEANINYNAYANKEIYPFAYFGNNKLIHIKDLPEDFYAYRETVDYNANHLRHFYSYNRFMFSHIDNMAAHSHYEKHTFHNKFDRHAMDFNKSKLDLIDSLISDETIKNNLLKYKTRDYVSHNHTETDANEMLDYYLAKSTNDSDKKGMKELVSSLKLLRQGNPLPDLDVINFDGEEHELSAVIDKPTVIYFWSSNSKMQYRNSHYKVKELKSKFPKVDFISINLNRNDGETWKAIISDYNFPTEKEFKFKNPKKARRILAVNYSNKAIVVNENTTILHPNVNIFKTDFPETLSNLVQKKHLIVSQ
ncbi:thioredoxin-like domain-containing protein [Winogradskyella sp. PE311]|uniref:thioredoxin-like domain-containing protein n=1 Tax=Winogradskyella sp. PE311 TaxID=3366943 RepID=UPI00397FD10E